MLLHRVLSAIVGIPVAVVLVARGGVWLALPVALLALIGLREFGDKAEARQLHVIQPWSYLMALGFI